MKEIKTKRRPLSERAKNFCRVYVENGYVGKRAYMEAYQNDNESTAQIGSYQLLKDPRVQEEIAFIEGTYKSLAYKVGLTKELVVRTLVDMMTANKIIVKKDGTSEIVPDWFARNQAISQYAKLTGDFNEKNEAIEKKSKEVPVGVEEGVEKVVIGSLSKEELEARKQKILSELVK